MTDLCVRRGTAEATLARECYSQHRNCPSSGAGTYNKLFHVPFQAHIGKVWHHVCDHLEPSVLRALERFADGAHRVATASHITP